MNKNKFKVETKYSNYIEHSNKKNIITDKLRISVCINNILKELLCNDNLDLAIDGLCRNIINLFNVNKVIFVEKPIGTEATYRNYLNKNKEIITSAEVIDDVDLIAENKNGFLYGNNYIDVKEKIVGFVEGIDENFKVMFYVKGFDEVNDLAILTAFIRDLQEIIKNLYLKEFKYLALMKESYKDGLTRCYNRAYFELKMAELRLEENLGVIVLDLDCLKDINDRLGHDFGDRVIKKVARIINSNINEDDIFCRFGGDEFVILTLNKTEENMKFIIDKIEKSFNKVNETSFPIHVSLGYSIKVKSNDSIKDAFKMADYRMYGEKIINKGNRLGQVNKYIEEILKRYSDKGIIP